MEPTIVGTNTDTLIISASGVFPDGVGAELDEYKTQAQELEDDVSTRFTFAGETFYCKPHGSQRHWRWILHCPSLHLDLGLGKRNQRIARARFSAAYLWEVGPGDALAALYTFLVDLLGGETFTLQVSEVHLCADVAGWEPALDDVPAFITRGHNSDIRVESPDDEAGDETNDETVGDEADDERTPDVSPAVQAHRIGRRCSGFDFSRGAAHACCIYDKTKEIQKSGKEWMQAVWERNGWDGVSRVVRVEFRYKRTALRELGVDEPYAMLAQLAGLWAYSTAKWLRHTIPTDDTNRGRWPLSPFWAAIQSATFDGDPTPAVREKKRLGDLEHICQMVAGCSTTAAAYLVGELPPTDDGAMFLTWFLEWMDGYHQQRGVSFDILRRDKMRRLGVVVDAPVMAQEGEHDA